MALTKVTSGVRTLGTGEVATANMAVDPTNASNLASGTVPTARMPSTGTSWQAVQTTGFTAVAGNGYPCNTTSGAYTVTLPASASVGDTIELVDYAGTWDTGNITLDPQSLNLKGQTDDVLLITEREAVTLVYVDATQGWVATGAVNEDAPAIKSPYDIEYLVVAGGAGGGSYHRSGGGGAGGYRNSFASETSGRNSSTETPWNVTLDLALTVTIGAGGTMGTSSADGGPGSTSSIAMTGQTTVSSYGGGGGATYSSNAPTGTFGSGGGAGHQDSVAHTGASGTAAQGFDGGDTPANTITKGGAGGGASADGAEGGVNSPSHGGDGLASSITGAAVTRAGGGGAGSYGSASSGYSSGGAGGGGNGGSDDASDPNSGVSDGAGYYYPVSGTVNTGGGGGGVAGTNGNASYGAGGSGVVILRVATTNYTGTTTGSPTVTTDGLYKVLVFNASGSYTS